MHARLHFRPIVSFLIDPLERLTVTERKAALRKIAVGDMFHASLGRDGPSYPCLALRLREDAIFARRMTTQSVHWFDRRTGAEIDDGRIVIDSV